MIALDEPACASYKAVGFKVSSKNASYACASRLLRSAKVAERIRELQEQAARRHEAKIETITRELDEAYAGAMATHQHSAAVSAAMGKAKLHGLLINRSERREPGGFEHCKTIDDVIDTMIEEAGSIEAALTGLENIKRELEKRLDATQATRTRHADPARGAECAERAERG
jgi:hypothetical protein